MVFVNLVHTITTTIAWNADLKNESSAYYEEQRALVVADLTRVLSVGFAFVEVIFQFC